MEKDIHKYKDLFDTMDLGVVYQDAEGKILEANTTAEKILGLTKEQMTRLDPDSGKWKAVKEDGTDLPGKEHPAMVALATGKRVKNVVIGVYNPKLEEYRWINMNAVPEFRKDEKKPFRVYTTFHDISELRQVQKSCDYFKSAVESSSNAVGISTPEGKHWYQNKAFDQLFGNIGEDLPSSLYVDEKLDRRILKTLMAGDEWYGEIEMYGKKKEILHIYLRAYPIKDNKNKVIGLVSLHTDITARKKSELTLKESEKKFRSFFENEPGYCYMISPDGLMIDINKSALDALGYRKDELIGKPLIPTIYSKSSRKKAEALFKKWQKTGILKNEELNITAKNGEERTVLLGADSVKDDKGEILYSVSVQRDITEQKKAEKQLRLTMGNRS